MKVIELYKRFIFGDDTTFDFQKRIFLLITHLSIIIGIIGIVVDIVLDLGVFLIFVTVLTVLALVLFHTKVRNSKLETQYALGFFLISIVVFSLLWFYNGGYNGNIILLIFVYFTVIVTILPAKLRLLSIIVYAILITALTLLHYYYPNLVTTYASESNRFIDLIVGYIMYLILAYNIQNIILKNYDKDHKKINLQNDQLNILVEKLNEANSKLEQSIKNVEELNASKDRFITVLSHDLRSPFQGLLGITKTLESSYTSFSDNEKQFYISQVNQSLDKLYAFLEQLLLWGKVQKNTVKLNYESCNIKELLSHIASVLTSSADKKKISIDIKCNESLNAVFDKEMIAIVLRNLLSNAIKFSPFGSGINVNAEMDNSELKISVIDNGIGMSDESINKLFNLDENISTIGTDGELGSGMGLILSKDILKKHNGNISVQSKEGKGSTFIIKIPSKNI